VLDTRAAVPAISFLATPLAPFLPTLAAGAAAVLVLDLLASMAGAEAAEVLAMDKL
jgi:hypothetical protein